jgi:hypothetical protein
LWHIDRVGLLYAETEHAGTAELIEFAVTQPLNHRVQAAGHTGRVTGGLT